MYPCHTAGKIAQATGIGGALTEREGKGRPAGIRRCRVTLPGAKGAGASSSSLGYIAVVDRQIIDLHKSTRQEVWRLLGDTGSTPLLCPVPFPHHKRDIGSLAALLGLPTWLLTDLLPVTWTEQNVFVKAFICLNKGTASEQSLVGVS